MDDKEIALRLVELAHQDKNPEAQNKDPEAYLKILIRRWETTLGKVSKISKKYWMHLPMSWKREEDLDPPPNS